MNLQIRPFAFLDIDAILAIENLSFSDPWTHDMFAGELQDREYDYSRVAVIEETGEVVGYCFFWIILDDEVQISNIAVHPQYRRQGIAQRLIEEAILLGREKHATSISLEVRESNLPARTFYAKLGFAEVGRRPRYYHMPVEDAFILRMKI